MVELFRNVFSSELQNQIEDYILGTNINWFLSKSVDEVDYDDGLNLRKYQDTDKFCHQFVANSSICSRHTNHVLNMIQWQNLHQHLGVSNKIIKFKSNILFRTNQRKSNTPHIDSRSDHDVLIYYVIDSDGPTILYNKQKGDDLRGIKKKFAFHPKKGEILKFDGSIYHSSTPPRKNNLRCVLNFDLAK